MAPTPLRPLLRLAGASAFILLLLDLALFRSGWYAHWIEPQSTAGSAYGTTLLIAHYRDPARKNVLVLGNSQIAEGFSAARADADAARADLHFVNGAVPGTTPRVWNYLLRAVDPDADRFAAVALMIDGNLDTDREDLTNYPLDTRYLLPLLGLGDTFDYPDSFTDPNQRAAARRAILLPLQTLHDDVFAFAANPRERRRAVRPERPGWIDAVNAYEGHEERLPELSLDAASGQPLDWNGVDPALRAKLDAYFHMLRAAQDPSVRAPNDAYYRTWLGRIAARYRARGVPVFVFVVPRGPWQAELVPAPHYTGAEADAIAAGQVRAIPADAFVALEKPQYFFDTLHMNRSGRERFTRELAQRIAAQVP